MKTQYDVYRRRFHDGMEVGLPNGHLTPTQHRILRSIWNRGAHGATVSEIWRHVSSVRPVGRTTVLNLVDRLEKRGWLIRHAGNGANRYVAAMGREKTAGWLARGFVVDYFAGSSVDLLKSLLAVECSRAEVLGALREMLKRNLDKNSIIKGRK